MFAPLPPSARGFLPIIFGHTTSASTELCNSLMRLVEDGMAFHAIALGLATAYHTEYQRFRKDYLMDAVQLRYCVSVKSGA